jgi:hypothetical protein
MECPGRKDEGSGHGDRAGRLLALVAELGNVSAACRALGVDRSAYYRILRANRGGAAPDGGAPARRRNALPPEAGPAILRLCLEHPEWGCDRLAHYLTLTAWPVSSPTVQKILIRNGLGRVPQRMAERERRRAG